MGKKKLKLNLDIEFSKRQIMVMLAILTVSIFAVKLGTETMTLTTYYPAPYGAYAKFKTTKDTFLATHKGSKLGIGTLHPSSKVTVNGGMTIGNAYLKTSAPSNGLVIQGKVGIGTKDSKGPLDVYSKTGGFIPPRMTTPERNVISRPPAGSIIYNLQNKIVEYYDSAKWKPIRFELPKIEEKTPFGHMPIPWGYCHGCTIAGIPCAWGASATVYISLEPYGFTKTPDVDAQFVYYINKVGGNIHKSCVVRNITKNGFYISMNSCDTRNWHPYTVRWWAVETK